MWRWGGFGWGLRCRRGGSSLRVWQASARAKHPTNHLPPCASLARPTIPSVPPQTVADHLRLEQVVSSIDGGTPEGAPLADRAAWLWRCHLHFWSYR